MRQIFSEVDAVTRLAPKAPAQKLRSGNFSLRVGHGRRTLRETPTRDVPGLAGRAGGVTPRAPTRWRGKSPGGSADGVRHVSRDATSRRLRMLMTQAFKLETGSAGPTAYRHWRERRRASADLCP
jgi:hypothetical protein